MAIFLLLKQIVDLFYVYQWLDYLMVVFALSLTIFTLYKTKWSLKYLIWPDFLVLGLSLLALVSFLQDISSYQTFFKVLSAYLLYFMGRICYKSTIKYTYFCTYASYIVIWVNFVHKLVRNHGNLFARPDNSGEFYYYKTDMAFAMVLGAIFIIIYGTRLIEKLLTTLFVVPYMVFSSGARMLWFGLIIVYVILGLYLIEKKTKKELHLSPQNISIFLGVCVVLIALFLVIVSNKTLHEKFDTRFYFDFSEGILTENNTHGRFQSMSVIFDQVHSDSILRTLFGHPWNGEVHALEGNNISVADCHCLYLKYLYSNGYVGLAAFLVLCFVSILFADKQKNRELYYTTFGSLTLFLIVGVSVSTIILTQMSWLPFLFTGACLSQHFQEISNNSN